MSEMSCPEMLPIKEVSNRTSIPYEAIRRLCLQKKIVFIKCGSKYLINFNKFIEYLNTGGTNGSEAN